MRLLGRKSNLRLLFRRPMALLRHYWLPLAILVICAAMDGITTYQFLVKYGPGEEVHPVQQLVFWLLPPLLGVIVAKGGQTAFVAFVACFFRGWTKWMMLLAGFLYAAGAACNYFGWMVYLYKVFPCLL